MAEGECNLASLRSEEKNPRKLELFHWRIQAVCGRSSKLFSVHFYTFAARSAVAVMNPFEIAI